MIQVTTFTQLFRAEDIADVEWRYVQGTRLARLLKTMMQPLEGQSKGDRQPDVAAAAATLGVLVANQPLARGALLQQGALPVLLTMLQQGSMAQQSVAANVLFDVTEGWQPSCTYHL